MRSPVLPCLSLLLALLFGCRQDPPPRTEPARPERPVPAQAPPPAAMVPEERIPKKLLSFLTTDLDWRKIGLLQGMGPLAEPAIPEIVRRLGTGDGLTASYARTALSKLGDPAIRALLKEIRYRGPTSVQCAKLVATLTPRDPELLLDYRRALFHADDEEMPHVTHGFARLGDGAVPILVKRLTAREASLRRSSAEGLGLMGDRASAAVPGLVNLLKDPLPEVRIAAARALGEIGADPEESLGALVAATLDEDSCVETEAALALSRFGQDAVEWLPQLERALSRERTRWLLLPLLVLGDEEKAREVWKDIVDAPRFYDDENGGLLILRVLELFRSRPDAALAAFPMLFEGLVFESTQVREAIEDLVRELDASGPDADRLWAGVLRAPEDERLDEAVSYFRRNPGSLVSRKIDVKGRLSKELSGAIPDSHVVAALLALQRKMEPPIDPSLYMGFFRVDADSSPELAPLLPPTRGLIEAGPAALGAILAHRLPRLDPEGEPYSIAESTSNVNYLLALAFRSIVEALPADAAEKARKSMSSHPSPYNEHLTPAEPVLFAYGNDGAGKRSWKDGGLEVDRFTSVVDFPHRIFFTALQYLPGQSRLLALTEEGILLTLEATSGGPLRVVGYRDLRLLTHREKPWPVRIDGEWTCLTASASGEIFAVGSRVKSSGSELEEKETTILLFRTGTRDPILVERLPFADLEELHIDEKTTTLVALEYWRDVHWLRYEFGYEPGLKIETTKSGGFCCQVAGTLLSDGRTFVTTTHHGGLAALHPEKYLRPIYFPDDDNRPQLARALPDDGLVCKMMNDDFVRCVDGRTGEIRWSTELHPRPGTAAFSRCAACSKYWAAYGSDRIALGRTSDGEVIAYLPLDDEEDSDLAPCADDRNNHRVLAFNPDGSELFIAASGMEGQPRLVHFRLKEK